jgi:aspartyl-tRNA(Asn)/glutamyl-tRNA(Gln) amidotransferase subunit C
MHRMSRITLEQARHVARLAQVAFVDEELESLLQDLDAVLDYVQQLDELNLDNVEPTTHGVPLELPARDDAVEAVLTREDILRNAPDVLDGMFRVPRVVEGGN